MELVEDDKANGMDKSVCVCVCVSVSVCACVSHSSCGYSYKAHN